MKGQITSKKLVFHINKSELLKPLLIRLWILFNKVFSLPECHRADRLALFLGLASRAAVFRSDAARTKRSSSYGSVDLGWPTCRCRTRDIGWLQAPE